MCSATLFAALKGLEEAPIWFVRAMPSNTIISIRGLSSAALETKAIERTCSSRGRSMEQRVTRKPRRRGCLAGTECCPSCYRKQEAAWFARRATRHIIGVLVDDLVTRWRGRTVPHVHEPSRVSPEPPRRQCGCSDSHLSGATLGCVDDTRWDAYSLASMDTVSRETARPAHRRG